MVKPPPTQIQSVARASRLLLLAARRPQGLGPTDAARELGTADPTAYHLLNTLAGSGLLARDHRRRFVLGPAAGALAEAWLAAEDPPEFLSAPLRALVTETSETAYLSAWRHDRITVLGSLQGGGAVRVAEAARGPYRLAHARATGKLLLAFADPARRDAVLGPGPLERVTPATITDRTILDAEFSAIRARGWAEDHEEFAEGVACVAAPAVREGTVIAAYTVSAPAHRFAERRESLLAAVRRAAGLAAGVQPAPLPASEVA